MKTTRGILRSITASPLLSALILAIHSCIACPLATASDSTAPDNEDAIVGAAKVTKQLAGQPDDAATQQRVRELIYVLRGHRVFDRNDEWAAAIRELTEIGSPALPELILELNTTERSTTMRGLLYTIRAIGDPYAMDAVVAALPKASRLSRGSDCGIVIVDPELHRFMKQNQNHPDDNVNIAYGRPINEILSTLHKLSKTPLPDLTKRDPKSSWNANYWQEKWKTDHPDGQGEPMTKTLSRNEDLVERDGIKKFGPLFPTGPNQRLSPGIQFELACNGVANGLSYLDLDTGTLYEYREGDRYQANRNENPNAFSNWQIKTGVDIQVNGGCDLHYWLIDNDRWATLDAEIQAEQPLDIGREALMLAPFDKDPYDFKYDRLGTFLFTTREGGRGVLRVYPYEKGEPTRRYEYRLWNADKINLHPAVVPAPRKHGEWSDAKLVVLKRPAFGNQCFYSFKSQKPVVFDESVFAPNPAPKLSELVKRGSIFDNKTAADWAQSNDIALTTICIRFERLLNEKPADGEPRQQPKIDEQIGLALLQAKVLSVTPESFGSLSVDRIRKIYARTEHQFNRAYMTPSLEPNAPPATFVFETKSGQLGQLQILKTADQASTIIFQYELANTSPEKSQPNE